MHVKNITDMPAPRISVVIPTYNEEDIIEKGLSNFSNQSLSRDEFEIVVVDGGSTDETVRIAKKYADTVIQQKSKGVGGARNDGVEVTRAEIVATTDIDVILPDFWLERILMHFKRKEVVGVCGPNEPIERKFRARAAYFVINFIHPLSSLFNLTGMPGNNTAFKKSAFLSIGGYDTDAPYLDDIEMGLRLRKAGKVVFDRNLMVKISMRRLEESGYLKVLLLWLYGDARLAIGKKVKKISGLRYFRRIE